jgi:phosphatidylinositol alpha 1,6-mannosyltransferase
MKIAFFNANLRIGQDGVTRVMYRLFNEVVARNIEAVAFTATLPDDDTTIIPMFRMPSVVLPLQKNYRLASPRYKGFEEKLNAFQPDIIHVHSPCTLGFAAVKYAQRYGIPVVSTYHTHFPSYPRYYKFYGFEEIVWKMMRYFYNQMDRTFVPTEPILNELVKHRLERLHYIPNGTDVDVFNPKYRSGSWRQSIGPGGKPILLFVSRLVWEKDIRILADAYNQLRARRDDFEMVIVGDGHARADLETMMPGAHFLGFKTGRELATIYASSDIFVFPSTTETFGLVTVEAMASGLVPVAAQMGGAVGIIEENNSGLFTEPLNAHHMRSQVERLLDRPEERKRLAENAVRRAQHFNWGSILDTLFESYEDVIEEYRQSRRTRAA